MEKEYRMGPGSVRVPAGGDGFLQGCFSREKSPEPEGCKQMPADGVYPACG